MVEKGGPNGQSKLINTNLFWRRKMADFFDMLESLGKDVIILVCLGVMFIAGMGLGRIFFDSNIAGIIIWCVMMGLSFDHFLVSVPEVTGLVTVNMITGDLVVYGTGLHFKFPWEQVKQGNYINLRIITEQIKETFPSKNAMLLVKWSFQYRPIITHLPVYIAADDNTIKEGLADIGNSILSDLIGGREADKCKEEQQELEKELKDKFSDKSTDLDGLYGIKIMKVSLADVDYEDAVQKARAAQKESDILLGMATKIKGSMKDLTDKEAYDNALVSSGKVTKTITEVVGEGANALAGLVKAALDNRGNKK